MLFRVTRLYKHRPPATQGVEAKNRDDAIRKIICLTLLLPPSARDRFTTKQLLKQLADARKVSPHLPYSVTAEPIRPETPYTETR